jgi:ceramide glucosyltransferase
MRADARTVASALALGAAVASIGYTTLAIARLRAFGRRVRERAEPAPRGPAVTVLKPVRGLEPGLEENLRSFCAQDYPDVEVVFGVRDPGDPALEVIRRVAASFPDRTSVVVGDGVARFRNPKIATLAPMLEHATGDVLVIADSDMRVTPDYLRAVVAPFADERVGAVTCLYRGERAAHDLASTLGAMWINEQFAPSVLVANVLEPLTYCFGATMAVRRDVLEAIGGLAALGEHLADDHTLGRLVTERGFRIALADHVVVTTVSEPGFSALLRHEVRWARTIRAVRPQSYAGILLTYPLPLALVYAAVARRGRATPAIVVLLAALARAALRRAAHDALGTSGPPPAWLVPVRDALGVATWAIGLAGRDVRWRDEQFWTAWGSDALDAR